MLPRKPAPADAACSVLPDDFVAQIIPTEYAVEQLAEIAVCGVIAVQVQAPRRLKYAAQLNQPDPHVAKVRGDAVAVDELGGVDQRGDAGVGVVQTVLPFLVNVLFPGPDVPEACLRRLGPGDAGIAGGAFAADAPCRQQAAFD